jgi:hypothetical protein
MHEMCHQTGFAFPGRIAVCACWREINADGSDFPSYQPKMVAMAYDQAGRFVTAAGRLSTESLIDGKIRVTDDSVFDGLFSQRFDTEPSILRTVYYQSGNQTFELDLPGLPLGVCSIAFAILSLSQFPLYQFKRKALRVVNLDNAEELGIAHIHAECRTSEWGLLIGGLAYARDSWHWVPAGVMVRFRGIHNVVHMASPIWHQRLVQFGFLSA